MHLTWQSRVNRAMFSMLVCYWCNNIRNSIYETRGIIKHLTARIAMMDNSWWNHSYISGMFVEARETKGSRSGSRLVVSVGSFVSYRYPLITHWFIIDRGASPFALLSFQRAKVFSVSTLLSSQSSIRNDGHVNAYVVAMLSWRLLRSRYKRR